MSRGLASILHARRLRNCMAAAGRPTKLEQALDRRGEMAEETRGYLDRMISGYFKTAQDGRKLFYPWGPLGSGYVIASEKDYTRVAGSLKTYIVVLTALTIGAFSLAGYLSALVMLPGAIIFYFFWKPYLVRGLQPSEEKLSLRESYTNQALARSPKELWSWEIAGLVVLGVSVVTLTGEDFESRLTGLALLVIAVFCMSFAAWMLVLRRRATRAGLPR